MDKIRLITAAAVLALSVSSCQQNGPYQRELATVDSLQVEVGRFEDMIQEVDMEKLRSKKSAVDSHLKQLYKADSVQLDKQFLVMEIAPLANAAKSLNRFSENRDGLLKELQYSEKQLKTLHNSIHDEKLDSAEVQRFLQDEQRALHVLRLKVHKNYSSAKQAMSNWDSMESHYDSLSTELSQNR